MALIKIDNIKKEYIQGTKSIFAIGGLSLKIEKGEFVVILGKSGSGKSTLLSLIGGLEQPTEGTIFLDQKNLSLLTEDELALLRRKEVGIIFQHFHLMDAMTAIENVELPLLIAGKNRDERRQWALKLLHIVGLDGRETHYPNELSGGERQRVGIARALANKAELIIADEPTGDLDSSRGREIVDLLFKINKFGSELPDFDWQPTIVMVTHDVGMLREGMRVLTLSDGMIKSDQIFDGDYDKFDPLGTPSVVEKQIYNKENSTMSG